MRCFFDFLDDEGRVQKLANALETLGKSHQLRVTNFFAPTKSKEDREFYQTNMVTSEYSILNNDRILMPIKGLTLNSLSGPRDFYFHLAIARQKQLVQTIENIRNTIFSVLAEYRAHLIPIANITALLKALKLRKPDQTGVLFRGVYINDREFLASALNTKASLPGADTFYVTLGEKAEEAKELRRQNLFYFHDWNELVNGCIKILSEGKSQDINDQTVISSINSAMEARLANLKRELVTLKLDSLSLLAHQHTVNDGRKLINLPKVGRISRRILIAVHQLFADTADDLLIQQKMTDRVRRVFLFDYNNENESNQYTKTWNAYFGKIANGNVPTDFPQAQSRILASLKATLASRVSKDRELRCLLKNATTSSYHPNHEHVKIPPNDKCFFLENLLHTIKMWLSEKMINPIHIQDFVDVFINQMYATQKWFSKYVICHINNIQDILYAFINKMHVTQISLSENMICQSNHIQNLVYEFIDQMDVTQKSLSENISQINYHIQHLVDGFIDHMHTIRKSLSENMMCQFNYIHDLVDTSMDQLHAIWKSLSQILFNMTSHLVKTYRPFTKDLVKYFFIAIQMVQQIFAGAFYILSATPTILQEVFIKTPAYVINNIYTGICLFVDDALNAIEQYIIHFPIHVAWEVYKELLEEIKFAAYTVSSLLMAHPYYFVTICYIALYATCL